IASRRRKGPWYVDVVREGLRPSGCPRPKRRRGWLRRKHRSLTLWWQRRAAVRGFCFRRHTFLGGTSEEPRPWAIKRERSPGRFCPALLVVSSSEFTLSHGHWKCRCLLQRRPRTDGKLLHPFTLPLRWWGSRRLGRGLFGRRHHGRDRCAAMHA